MGLLYELQELVNQASELAGVPASLTDSKLDSIVFGPHDDVHIDHVRRDSLLARGTADWVRTWFFGYGIKTADSPVRVLPDSDHDTMSRVVVPARWAGITQGYLCLLDEHQSMQLDALDLVVERATEMGRILQQDTQAYQLDAYVLHDLLEGEPDVRLAAAQRLVDHGRFPADTAAAVAVLDAPGRASGPSHEDLWRWASTLPTNVLSYVKAGRHVLVIPVRAGRSTHATRRVVEDAKSQLEPAATGIEVYAGLGAPQRPLSNTYLAYHQAWRAATVAPALGKHQVAEWETLGVLRFLASVPQAELANCIDPKARILFEEADTTLARTLETYLDTACDARSSAAQLTIHRGTLYYRLRRIADLTGADMDDGLERLALHLSLKASRIEDTFTGD